MSRQLLLPAPALPAQSNWALVAGLALPTLAILRFPAAVAFGLRLAVPALIQVRCLLEGSLCPSRGGGTPVHERQEVFFLLFRTAP